MNLVLIGFMCAGKSHVGETLARRLGWTHVDTDEAVRQKTGVAVPDLIRSKGEAAFRIVESAAVADVANKDRCVISTGGGVPLNPANVAALRATGRVVWLDVDAATVLRRAGSIASRPLIDPSDPEGSIRRRLDDRRPVYRAAADRRVDTVGRSVDDVCIDILSAFPELKS